jgi:hypothetical protein
MDTKAYPNLDPKLKETYDRIMGTGTSAQPQSHAPVKHEDTVKPHMASGAHTPPAPKSSPTTHRLSHIAYNATDGNLKGHDEKEKHEEKKSDSNKDTLIIPIVLGVCGVIFFVFYSIFWMNFFGM